MYVIVGLGNPGLKYKKTRHNVGFDTLDVLADRYGIAIKENKHKALIGKGVIEGQQVLLAKPQTFMNLSGESVIDILNFYKLDPEKDLLVISDDVALDVGVIRVRGKGSAGGHNGLKNIIAHTHTENFARVRIGVGKLEPGEDMITHVLGRVSRTERGRLERTFEEAADAVVCVLTQGTDAAMNAYNGKVVE